MRKKKGLTKVLTVTLAHCRREVKQTTRGETVQGTVQISW